MLGKNNSPIWLLGGKKINEQILFTTSRVKNTKTPHIIRTFKVSFGHLSVLIMRVIR